MKVNSVGSALIDLAACELGEVEKEVLQHPQVGGLVLFSRNFECIAQLKDLVRSIREIRPNILLTVDQEGGRVQRFKNGFTRIPSMQRLGDAHENDPSCIKDIFNVAWVMTAELRCLGIDLSFAPVLDVDRCLSDVIGDRSFSDNANTVSLLAETFIDGMNAAGMPATGKHFPGHGGIKSDSHIDIAVDDRLLEELLARDLIPFKNLLPKLGLMMPAHVIFKNIDEHPVGFSSKWLDEIIRKQMSYDGVLVSDDLKMEGAAVAGSMPERAEAALNAGCDAVLICNAFEDAVKTIEVMESQNTETSKRLLSLVAECRRPTYPDIAEISKEKRWQQAQDFLENLA